MSLVKVKKTILLRKKPAKRQQLVWKTLEMTDLFSQLMDDLLQEIIDIELIKVN
jgi:hypothetical protein